MESMYHFRDWLADVRLWAEATDLPWANQGPAVALLLGGLAKELAREVPPDQLTNGVNSDFGDGSGPTWHSGLDVLLRGLTRTLAPWRSSRPLAL